MLTWTDVVDHTSIGELVNTDESPFWYHTQYEGAADAKYRYKHEKGKVGDVFWDGNNGDRWVVLAINTKYKRIVVENRTQSGTKLAYWE